MRSRCNRSRGELGAVTAELAAATPAVLVVLALAVGGVAAAAQQVGLQHAAGDAARAVARGDDPGGFAGGAAVAIDRAGGLACVTLSDTALGGLIALRAASCADAAGR